MQKLRENLHWYILGLLFATTIFIWYAVVQEDRQGILTVAFLDIGQGDAIFKSIFSQLDNRYYL